jgi:ABC-type multidrug transport system fused ATPase/permease subunit
MNNGRIVEHGTHKSLMAIEGEYFELYNLSLIEENTVP